MGYYNPIGVALRDVGAGIGDILHSEARRRQDLLNQQVATGDIGLRYATLRNQAAQQQGALGVDLARAQAQGRYQEQQVGLERQRTEEAGQAGAAQRAHQLWQQGAETRRLDEVRRHAQVMEGVARQQAASQQMQAAAAAAASQAQTNLHKLSYQQQTQTIPVQAYHDAMKGQLTQQYGEQEGEALMGKGRMIWQVMWGDYDTLPVNPQTGQKEMPMWQAQGRAKFANELIKMQKGETMTAAERQSRITQLMKTFEDDPALGTADEKYAVATALVNSYNEFERRYLTEVESMRPALEANGIAAWKKANPGWFGKTREPTMEELATIRKTHVEPLMHQGRVRIARELAMPPAAPAPAVPTPVPAPAPPPAAPAAPAPAGPSLQAATTPAARVPPDVGVLSMTGPQLRQYIGEQAIPALGRLLNTPTGELLGRPAAPAAPAALAAQPLPSGAPQETTPPTPAPSGQGLLPPQAEATFLSVLAQQYGAQIPDGAHAVTLASGQRYVITTQGGRIVGAAAGGR